jgi:hypothetical protein
MAGGFHPWHSGHSSLYQSAQRTFPDAEVYVAATNDTSTRPFPFAVKEKLARLAGVETGHFVQVKSPFRAEEITAKFDPSRDVLIFVRSEKDANTPPQAGGVKRDGSPSYLQPLLGAKRLEPFSRHAYMAYLPTVEFGPGMTSATQIRTAWPTLNEKRKTALVMSLYPRTQTSPQLATTVVKLLDAAIGGQEVAEGSESSIEKKIQAKQDSLSLAREQRRARGQRQQGQREIKLQAEIDKLNTELTQLKQQGVAEANVAKYKDQGATDETTHFIKNVTTGEIVSPHRSLQDAKDALVGNMRGSNDQFKIVRARKGVAESYDLDAFSGIKFLNPKTGKMGSFYYWSSMEGKNDAYSMITNKKLVPAHNDGAPMTWDEYKRALDDGYQGVAEASKRKQVPKELDRDPQLRQAMLYAKQHYPQHANDPEMAMMKWLQRGLNHSEREDQQHDRRIAQLTTKVASITAAINQLKQQVTAENNDYLDE